MLRDANAHLPVCLQGCQAIIAGEETADFGIATCNAAEHERPMRDGFIAGDGNLRVADDRRLYTEIHNDLTAWRSANRLRVGAEHLEQ